MPIRKPALFALLLTMGIGLLSCEKKNEDPTDPLFEKQVFAVSEVMFQRFLFEINLSFYKGLEKNGLIGQFLLNPSEVDCPTTTYVWNPVTKVMTIGYGSQCQPSTGFAKSGKIVVSMASAEWKPGSVASLELDDLVMSQRGFEGTMTIEHRDVVFGETYRQAISYQNLELEHEDKKVSVLSGTFPGVVNRGGGLLVSYDILGQGTGNYKGLGVFTTLITSPLQFSMACRDMGGNGFSKGLMESILGDESIQTSLGAGPECSSQLTLRIGDQVRNIPF